MQPPARGQSEPKESAAPKTPPPAAQDSVQPAEPPKEPAQPKTTESKDAQTTQQPPSTAPVQAVSATVIEVQGGVEWAAAGVSPLATEGWTPVKVGDELKPTTQIRTGLRSHVNLQFGETTTISIRSITHASVEQFYRSATAEDVKIGLGYGTVRGGSTEGTIKCGVIVDSPIATLAKRGTEGWEIQVEPGLGRFRISLAEFGLVDAIQKLGGDRTRSRIVRPGEYATQADIANMWIQQDIFNRVVYFYEPTSVSEADAEFMSENASGYSALAPGGGTALIDLSGRVSAEFVLSQTAGGLPGGSPDMAVGVRPRIRPEGNFGTPRTFRAIRPK